MRMQYPVSLCHLPYLIMSMGPRAIVYGGKGALGSVLVHRFKLNNWWVASIDLFPNEEADANVVITKLDSWVDQEKEVCSGIDSAVADHKIDAVLCVAGGWAGGNAASPDLVKNSDLMWKQSVWSSTIAAKIASSHLKENGLLTLPGAKPALKGTPGMIGYGMAKAAVQQLVKSLASDESGLPKTATTVAILPVTLDTPMNRKFMPKADHTTWTSLDYVADLFCKWIQEADQRPANGSLMQLITKGGSTSLIAA